MENPVVVITGGLSGLAGGLVTDLVRDQLEKLCEDDECENDKKDGAIEFDDE